MEMIFCSIDLQIAISIENLNFKFGNHPALCHKTNYYSVMSFYRLTNHYQFKK